MLLQSFPSQMFGGVDSYGLIAIPLFILIGEIMGSGGITRRLVELAMGFVGSVRGGLAYGVAATACVLLLGYYASHMLGSLRRGLPFGAGMALLYGLLYVLLQLEQTALVVGSIALFAVLALVMVLTRRVNWYGLSTPLGGTPAP